LSAWYERQKFAIFADKYFKMKSLKTLKYHPCATKELITLLNFVGSPQTRLERCTLAFLAKAQERMGDRVPSLELSADLTALFSRTLAVAAALTLAVAPFVREYTSRRTELGTLISPALPPSLQQRFADESSQAFGEIDRNSALIFDRCRELCFLSLHAAAEKINAALKDRAKK
jgi:hypothetical protein